MKRWNWNNGDYWIFWRISVRTLHILRIWITVVCSHWNLILIWLYTTFKFLYCAISLFRSGKTQLAHTLCVSTQVPFSASMYSYTIVNRVAMLCSGPKSSSEIVWYFKWKVFYFEEIELHVNGPSGMISDMFYNRNQ